MFYPCPVNYMLFFPSNSWGKQVLFLMLCECWTLMDLSWALCSFVIHMYSRLEGNLHRSLDFSLFNALSFQHFVSWTLTVFLSLDCQLQLCNSGTPSDSPWVLPVLKPRISLNAASWGNCQLCLSVSCSQGSLSFFAWHKLSWKPLFHLWSGFFVFVSDNKVSPIPTTPSCPQVEVPRDPGNGDLFKKMWV